VALAAGAHEDAGRGLHEALETFTAVHGRFEAARTWLDLAALASAQGDAGAGAAHLDEARRVFAALDVPHHVARVERLVLELPARAARGTTAPRA
jgi:hypothetical protein